MTKDTQEKSRLNWRWSLVNGFLLCTVVVFTVILSTYLYSEAIRKNVMETVDVFHSELASQNVSYINEKLNGGFRNLHAFAASFSASNMDIGSIYAKEAILQMRQNSDFSTIELIPLNGQIFDGTEKGARRALNLEYFKRASKGESVLDDSVSKNKWGESAIVQAIPLRRDGEIIGVVAGVHSVQSFVRVLDGPVFGGEGHSYLVKSNGDVLAALQNGSDKTMTNLLDALEKSNPSLMLDINQMQSRMRQGENGKISYRYKNENYTAQYTVAGINDWYLVSVAPQRIILRQTDFFVQETVQLTAVLLACAVALGVYVMLLSRRSRNQMKAAHDEMMELYESVDCALLYCDKDTLDIGYANDLFYSNLGWDKETFHKLHRGSLLDVVDPLDMKMLQQQMLRLDVQPTVTFELRMQHRVLGVRYMWVSVKQQYSLQMAGDHIFFTMTNVTNLKQAQDELRRNQEQFHIIMEQVNDVIIEWNMADNSVYHSEHFRKKFGYSPPTLDYPQSFLQRNLVIKEDEDAFITMFRHLREGEPYDECNFRLPTSDGHRIWSKLRMTTIFDERKRPVKAIGLLTDIDDLKQEARQNEEMAHRDALTGLLNRKGLEHEAGLYLSDRRRTKRGALIVIDADNFKFINDTYGHQEGDKALRRIANRLQTVFRSTDIVSRFGGDEFLVMMVDVSSVSVVEDKAAQMIAIEAGVMADEYQHSLTCSLGITMFEGVSSFDDLFKQADEALYDSKKRGKGCFSIYNPTTKFLV